MPSRYLLNASRNKRELSAAREAGYVVKVISSDKASGKVETDASFQLIDDGMTHLTPNVPRWKRCLIIIRDWRRLIGLTRRLHKDVISCHDLLALVIGWLSTWFVPKERKPKLIYDSHEYELGRNAKRSRVTLRGIKAMEGFLMKRCAFSIMVNDSIADEVQRIHSLKDRPVVVRNIPGYWELDTEAIAEQRSAFLESLNGREDAFLVMYHGGIMAGRGIESMLTAVSQTDSVTAVVLGYGEEGYIRSLRTLAKDLGVESRVVFHPAVRLAELYQYVGAADVGIIILPSSVKSYYLSLPNKLFENIQSLTPVIVSNFPELGGLTKRYGIGLTLNDSTNAQEIRDAIERMRTDTAFYRQCKDNLKTAKEELCWEKERLVLLRVMKECL